MSEKFDPNTVTDEQLDAIFAGLAQGVINICEGLTTIENESRIHRAMSALCELRSAGRIVLVMTAREASAEIERQANGIAASTDWKKAAIERQEARRERRKRDLAEHNEGPKPKPVDMYRVGEIVDVLGNNTSRVEYVGKVIKKSSRLHVQPLGDNPTGGHMAYENKFVRERVRKHEHRFGVIEPSAKPASDVECCNGCERSARELGIAVTP